MLSPGEKLDEGIDSTHFSWGAIAFVVNSEIDVKNLSRDQIQKIISGETKNWKDISRQDIPIQFIYGPSGKKLGEAFFGVKNVVGTQAGAGMEAINRAKQIRGGISHGPLELLRNFKKDSFRIPLFDGVEYVASRVGIG